MEFEVDMLEVLRSSSCRKSCQSPMKINAGGDNRCWSLLARLLFLNPADALALFQDGIDLFGRQARRQPQNHQMIEQIGRFFGQFGLAARARFQTRGLDRGFGRFFAQFSAPRGRCLRPIALAV